MTGMTTRKLDNSFLRLALLIIAARLSLSVVTDFKPGVLSNVYVLRLKEDSVLQWSSAVVQGGGTTDPDSYVFNPAQAYRLKILPFLHSEKSNSLC
jgi:hypothetical protein